MAKRILIVDDALFMRSTLKQILEKNGFEIAGEADSGTEALRMYKATHPDLVTMDITMPDSDGIEGLKLIREFDPHARVIMVSSMGQQHLVVKAIEMGALDFLVKPFSPERVVQSVEQYA